MRRVGVELASRVLSTRVELTRVSIGWSEVTVEGLTLYEPSARDDVQLSVHRISIVPSLWRGFREGIWLASVVIDRPRGYLRFDADGNLLSVMPQTGKSESAGVSTIPLSRLVVRSAGLVVLQTGREELLIEDVSLNARFDRRISIAGLAKNLLGANAQFHCDLDATSFAGSSRLTLQNFRLNTEELVRLPLVPHQVDTETINADIGIEVKGEHPANELDIRKHRLECHVAVRNVTSERFKMLCERFELTTVCDEGQIKLDIDANPLEGRLIVAGRADVSSPSGTATVNANLGNCQLQQVTRHFDSPELTKLSSTASGTAETSVSWDNGKVRFATRLTSMVSDSTFDGIELPVLYLAVKTTGDTSLADLASVQGVVEGDLQSNRFDVGPIATKLGLPRPTGTVKAFSHFELPLASILDPTTYSCAAGLKADDLSASNYSVADAKVSFQLRDGLAAVLVDGLSLRDEQDRIIAELHSETNVSLHHEGRLISSTRVSLAPSPGLANALGVGSLNPQGRVQVSTDASCPLSSLTDPSTWSAKARVRSERLSLAGESLDDIDWQVSLDAGEIRSDPLALKWRDSLCLVQTSGKVAKVFSLHGDIDIERLRVNQLSAAVSRFSSRPLPADGLAKISGQFSFEKGLVSDHQSASASGVASIEQASYAGAAIGNAELRWSADLQGLELTTASDQFLGGTYRATAQMVELDWTKTQLEGQFSGIQVPRLVAMSGQRIPTAGTLEGGFRVTSIASLEALSGDAWLNSRQVSVKRLPIEIRQATFKIAGGELLARGQGSLVEGRFDTSLNAQTKQLEAFFAGDSIALAKIPIVGQFKLSGLPINKVCAAVDLPREARSVSGSLSVVCTRQESAWDGRHLCELTGAVEDLRYQHGGLSQRMSMDVVVHPDRLAVSGIQGKFADGTLSGSGILQFGPTPSGRFDLSANRVNLRRASSPFGVNDLSGTGTVRVRGRIGPVVTGRLDVTISNAVAGGVAFRQADFPVDWTFTPSSKTARWQCRAGSIATGGGKVRIASEGSFANSLSTTTKVKIEKVDLAKLMKGASVGSGTIDGSVLLQAKRARSPNDFVGTYRFQLKNIEAMEIPILDQLPKMISLSPSVPGRGQDGGTVYGRIGGGLVHVDEIAIHQSNVQVLVTGKATLSGNLDLDVVASTESTSPTDDLVSLLDSPLMLAAPAPIALVVKANDMLKDRVVRVHVGGTAKRPTLRLQTGKQLSQDAVRFFLKNSFGTTVSRLSESQPYRQRR